MRCTALVLLATLAGAVPVGAEDKVLTLPSDFVDEKERRAFRRCRMAVIYEQRDPQAAALPAAFVRALREQMDFIMADTLFNTPAFGLKDSARRLRFFEEWSLDFSREIESSLDELRDPERRSAILIACQANLWQIMRAHIDTLIAWRSKAMGAETGPSLYPEPPAE